MDHPSREMKETLFPRYNQTVLPLLANTSFSFVSSIAYFHLSTRLLAFLLNFRSHPKYGDVQVMGLVVLGACPHSHVMSQLKYFHLFRCSLLHVIPVCNLLRHLHAVRGLVCPFARLSSWLAAQLCDVKLCHLCQH